MTAKSELQDAAQRLELVLDNLDAEMLRIGEIADDATHKFCEVRDLINDLEDD